MGPERSKALHNFTLPYGLKWGNQRYLRCAKVESNGEISTVHRRSNGSELIGRRMEMENEMVDRNMNGSNDRFNRKFRSPEKGDGIGAVREKLMFDLLTEADKMKHAIFKNEVSPLPLTSPSSSPAIATVTAFTGDVSNAGDLSRPWNLRTRRAACKVPNEFVTGAGGSKGGLKIDVNRANAPLPLRTENKSPNLRSAVAGGAVAGASSVGEKRRRVKFSVPLSRTEIEEDFMTMIGHRPPRRPKKRAKLVQKNLDTLFPGLWLTEITPDLYKVPEDQ